MSSCRRWTVVRRAIEDDCRHYIDVYCPELRGLPRLERLGECGWWADYEACVFYLELYRRLGGEVYTALLDGEVVGDIELLPHDDCLLGPRAYINVLWVKESARGRGVGTRLVGQGITWARSRGYRSIDTIPEEGAMGFYSRLGFRAVTMQVKAFKRPRSGGSTALEPWLREIGPGNPPTGMLLVTGTYRPGLFTWYSAWEDEYTPPQVEPLAYELSIGGAHAIALLDYYREDEASIVTWFDRAPDASLLIKTLRAIEGIASREGIARLFIQTWSRYREALENLGYRIEEQGLPWISRSI